MVARFVKCFFICFACHEDMAQHGCHLLDCKVERKGDSQPVSSRTKPGGGLAEPCIASSDCCLYPLISGTQFYLGHLIIYLALEGGKARTI